MDDVQGLSEFRMIRDGSDEADDARHRRKRAKNFWVVIIRA